MKSFEEQFGTFDLDAMERMVPGASSGDGIIRTKEQMVEWATKIDCDVLVATDQQLFVDIDTEDQFELFNRQIRLLDKQFYFTRVEITPSKQGLPHRHIKIQMEAHYSLLARIALQACLGSDPMREMLSVRRELNGEDNVVVFFEKK